MAYGNKETKANISYNLVSTYYIPLRLTAVYKKYFQPKLFLNQEKTTDNAKIKVLK